GCASHVGETPPALGGAPDPVDGVPCDGTPAEQVYVDVSYAGNGMPQVHPAECIVHSGTRVTWRTEAGAAAFELEFRGGSPGVDAFTRSLREQRDFPSRNAHGRQKVAIQARDVGSEVRLKYDVVANGERLDPAIIIRPR